MEVPDYHQLEETNNNARIQATNAIKATAEMVKKSITKQWVDQIKEEIMWTFQCNTETDPIDVDQEESEYESYEIQISVGTAPDQVRDHYEVVDQDQDLEVQDQVVQEELLQGDPVDQEMDQGPSYPARE